MKTLVIGTGWEGRQIPLPEAAVLRLAGADAARRLRARFALRARMGAFRRMVPRYQRVVAPSVAALELFAEARAHGVETVLLEDVPDMRGLHRDLDEAARRHPKAALLRRYRAPSELVARQEQERLLADRRIVFSAVGLERDPGAEPRVRRSRGLTPPPANLTRQCLAPPGANLSMTVLLAGPPLARAGVFEAAEAARRLGLQLVVRPCEVQDVPLPVASPEQLALDGVAAVVAPAWAESWPSVNERAAGLGIPVIATAQGAGLAPHVRVPAGDVDRLVVALQAVLDTEVNVPVA